MLPETLLRWRELNARHFDLFCTHLGQGPKARLTDVGSGGKLLYTGYSEGLNRVWGASFHPAETTDAIAEACRRFQEWKAQFVWLTESASGISDEYRHALRAAGFVNNRSFDWPGMTLALPATSQLSGRAPHCIFEEVEDGPAFDAWADTVVRGYEAIGNTGKAMAACLFDCYRTRAAGVFRYAAYVAGAPAAACAIHLENDVAGVHWVATRAAHRRQGLSSDLVIHALHEASQRGATLAVLQANALTLDLYRKMGFRVVSRYELFLRKPTSPSYKAIQSRR